MRTIALIVALALAAVPFAVSATSNVSPRYDGVYSGDAFPTPGMSAESCTGFSVTKAVITNGTLRSQKAPDQAFILALVTEEGYVTGTMIRQGGHRYPVDGRINGDTLVAGSIEQDMGCAWVLQLTRQQSE